MTPPTSPFASSDPERDVFVSPIPSSPLSTTHSPACPGEFPPSAADASSSKTDTKTALKRKSDAIDQLQVFGSSTMAVRPLKRTRRDSDPSVFQPCPIVPAKRKLDDMEQVHNFQSGTTSSRPTKRARLDSGPSVPSSTTVTSVKRKSDSIDEVHTSQLSTTSPRLLKRARQDSSSSTPPSPTATSVKRKSDAIDQDYYTSQPSTSSPRVLKRARQEPGSSVPASPTIASIKRKSDAIDQAHNSQPSDSPSPLPKRVRKDSDRRPSVFAAGKRNFDECQTAQCSDTVLPSKKRVFLDPTAEDNQRVLDARDLQLANWIRMYIGQSKSANNGMLGPRVRDVLLNEVSRMSNTRSKTPSVSAASFSSPLTAKKPAQSSKTHPTPSTSSTSGAQGQTCAPATATTSATQTTVSYETPTDTTRPKTFTPPTVTTTATQTEMGHQAPNLASSSQTESLAPTSMVSATAQTQADSEACNSVPGHQSQTAILATMPSVTTQADDTGHEIAEQAMGIQTDTGPAAAMTASVADEERDLESSSFSSDSHADTDATMTDIVADLSATTISSVDYLSENLHSVADQACPGSQNDSHSTLFNYMKEMEPTPAQQPLAATTPKKPLEEVQCPPLVDPTRVHLVQCRLRPETTKPEPTRRHKESPFVINDDHDDDDVVVVPSTSQSTSQPQPSQGDVINLCDSDDDSGALTKPRDTSEISSSRTASRSPDTAGETANKYDFYGISPRQESEARIRLKLRYQKMNPNGGPDEYPSPTVGLQLEVTKYLEDIDANFDTLSHVEQLLESGSQSFGVPEENDDTLQWTQPGTYSVMAGFPLVEDVDFVVPLNRGKPVGDCYWRSISFCMYNSPDHWAYVKAEHLAYLHHVLTEQRHARHRLYAEHLNSRFFDTSAAGLSTFRANLWQMLHMPHTWTPAVMAQVTADLYNICLITFTLEHNAVTETSVRGVYNSRHVFLNFTHGNHFRPMIPNAYPAWEFRYPRVTAEATAKYANAPKASSQKPHTEHPWRKEFSTAVLPPVPRMYGYDTVKIGRLLSSELYSA